jgi:hypothetical protein
MKRILFSSAIVLALCVSALQAQVTESTKRVERQHTKSPNMEKQLDRTQAQLVSVLKTGTPIVQAQAVQTIRELEQTFPEYPFEALLLPLEEKLKDESGDDVVRLLSALALDELHSDAGDAVIRNVADSTKNEGLQTLCKALMVRSEY